MSCIEVLEIRVTQDYHREFQHELEKLIILMNADQKVYTMKSYSKGASNTDYLLIIHHEVEIHNHKGSALGQLLAEALDAYGMVHRSIWYEWNRKTLSITSLKN